MFLRRRRSRYQWLLLRRVSTRLCNRYTRRWVFTTRYCTKTFREYIYTLHNNLAAVVKGGYCFKNERVPGYHVALLRGKTAVFGVWLWHMIMRLQQKFELQWPSTNCFKSVTSRIAPSQTSCSVHCTDSKPQPFAKWCQATARWRTEWRSVEVVVWRAISFDSRTFLVIPRILTTNLYVSLVIQPVVLQKMNNIQGDVSPRPHTIVVTQHALQSVDMLLGLLDYQMFLQSSTYGTSLDDKSIVIHNLHQPSLYWPTKCNTHGTVSHKLTFGIRTTQFIHVCMLTFKILVVTPVINVSAFHIWNGFSRVYTYHDLETLIK